MSYRYVLMLTVCHVRETTIVAVQEVSIDPAIIIRTGEYVFIERNKKTALKDFPDGKVSTPFPTGFSKSYIMIITTI